MRIVLCYPVESRHVDQIRAAAPGCEVVNAGQEGIDECLPTADIFLGHAKVPVDWDRVLAAGRLRWIQSSAAGLDHCLVPGVIDSDIVVSSASGLFAPQVAEQTFSLLFGLLRRLPLFFRAEVSRQFVRLPTDDLRGKTIGIVGMGGNGRMLVRTLSPWDVRALIPIVEAAGGYMTDWRGDSCADGGQVVASGDARVHAMALERLASVAIGGVA